MTPTRKGLVLSVGTPTRVYTNATGDASNAERMAEIDRLVWATTPLLQSLAWNTPRLQERRAWCLANTNDPRYNERQRETDELASNIEATREAARRNARAIRLHVIRLPEGLRATLWTRHGLDYRENIGDSDADFAVQWEAVVEILGDECPF